MRWGGRRRILVLAVAILVVGLAGCSSPTEPAENGTPEGLDEEPNETTTVDSEIAEGDETREEDDGSDAATANDTDVDTVDDPDSESADGSDADAAEDAGAGTVDDADAETVDDTDEEERRPEVHPANPYEKATLTVSIDRSAADRNTTPLIEDAVAYWENESETYAGYPIEYELRPNGTQRDSDIHVEFTEELAMCGTHDDYGNFSGCAPVVTSHDHVSGFETIRIETGGSDRHLRDTLVHEFGHTLGLTHDDEPALYMQPSREHWLYSDRDVLVSYSIADRAHEQEAERQIEHAVAYLNRSYASYLEPNGSVRITDDRDESSVHVNVTYDADDCPTTGSCANGGSDVDYLYSDQVEIVVVQRDADVIGWHVAATWLSYHLPREEQPRIFRDGDYDDASSDWWDQDPRPD